jgi:hypothetical protein
LVTEGIRRQRREPAVVGDGDFIGELYAKNDFRQTGCGDRTSAAAYPKITKRRRESLPRWRFSPCKKSYHSQSRPTGEKRTAAGTRQWVASEIRWADRLMISADGGGSNGSRVRLWKVALQKLGDETQLTLQVCHYPPGASKWNRIEHRCSATARRTGGADR